MLTVERLKEVLHYDPNTGVFTWRIKTGKKVVIGTRAGRTDKSRRNLICIDYQQYLGYRLAWLYVRGKWPDGEIDHINGDSSDDRFLNIRDVSGITNHQNIRSPLCTNTTGFLGVTFDKRRKINPYYARLSINDETVYVGSFKTAEAAYAAYVEAKRALHKGCTI